MGPVLPPVLPLLWSLAGLVAGGGGAPAGAFHAIAFVNDPLSHGAVGDGLLSLDEAIRLHNGTLPLAALSAAELAQLSLIPGTGSTSDVTWIDIDGGDTPVITIQQDLSPVLDTPFGLLIRGFGDRPVLDFSGPNLTRGMLAPANSLSLENLTFQGGVYGVDNVQTDATGQAGLTCERVDFVGQGQFAVRVTGQGTGGVSRLVVADCTFHNVPVAIVDQQSPSGRTTICEVVRSEASGCATFFDATAGLLGNARYSFDRVEATASVRGIRLVRAPGAGAGSGRQTFVEATYVRVAAPVAFDWACTPFAQTWAVFAMLHLTSTGGTALRLGQPGDALFGSLLEADTHGDVRLGCGVGVQPFVVRNLRARDAAVTLSTTPAQPLQVSETRCRNSVVTTSGTGPVHVASSSFEGGSVTGLPAAPFVVTTSFVATAGAHVQNTSPQPLPHLGSMIMPQTDVPLGSTATFHADLPPGLVALFALGFPASPPPTLPPVSLPAPFHVYLDLSAYVLLPGAFTGQQTCTWPAPNQPQFAGVQLLAQPLVLPDATLPAAAWLQFPPGRLFTLR
jgi:hypothetical protein